MSKRSQYIAAGLVILLSLLALNLPSRATASIKLALSSLFLPLFGLASGTKQVTQATGDALVPRGELLRQIDFLRRENQRLTLRDTQAAEMSRENSRLRQLVGWQTQTPWNLKAASVILRDPANWWRTIEINRGSKDGIRTNMPVLTVEGLIGHVSIVSDTHSRVVLLGDPNCRVSAIVENDARDMGVIGSGGVFDGSFVEMNYLPPGANLKAGQNIVTSGLGGIFPKGITVGKIADAQPVEYGLYTQAQVKLSASLGSLEEVWVMMQ